MAKITIKGDTSGEVDIVVPAVAGSTTYNLSTTGGNILAAGDIGTTVQGYDADTAKYDDATANFTGTLQNGGSNVVVDTDIGSTVLAYDSNLQSFVTAFTLPTTDGTANQVLSTDGSGNFSFVNQSGGSILTTNNIDENTAYTTTTTANQVIDSWSATTYRTAKYILQAVNGSDVHSTEILLNHDESNVYITGYATIYSNASLFTVSSQLNGSTLELRATPANANTTFDLVRTLLVARTSPTSSGDLQSLSGSEDLGSGSGSEDLN